MLSQIRKYLELVRFSHTVFALPFALLGAAMAIRASMDQGIAVPTGRIGAGVVLCMVFGRTAAMAFNRLVDRHYDAKNPRTRNRHLPAGTLTTRAVVGVTLAAAGGFVASTALMLPNVLPLLLTGPVLLFLLGYSYAKRFTSLSHFWLGAALMLAPVGAWIAVRGERVMADPWDLLPPATLGTAVLLWVAGFDIIYACQDYQFDRQAGLLSLPVRLGVPGALRVAAACHAGMVAALVALPLAGKQLPWGWLYWTGIALVAALLTWEHLLVRPHDLSRVNLAFFHVNAVVSIGLFVIGCLDLFLLAT